MFNSFDPLPVNVKLDKQASDIPWPPTPPVTAARRQIQSGSSLDLRLACGESHSKFTFNLYKYPANSAQNQVNQVRYQHY